MREILDVHMESLDELGCLVKGLGFLMVHVPTEAFTFHGATAVDRPMDGIVYPYLLANVGSGVSFIVVRSEHDWERVSGTSLGGGTFYGLCRMLTGLTSFDEMLNHAELGNNVNVDLTVGDIYGGDYAKFGLKSSTIAASFGKAITWGDQAESIESEREVCLGAVPDISMAPKPAAARSVDVTVASGGLRSRESSALPGLRRRRNWSTNDISVDGLADDVEADGGSFGSIGGVGVRRHAVVARLPPRTSSAAVTPTPGRSTISDRRVDLAQLPLSAVPVEASLIPDASRIDVSSLRENGLAHATAEEPSTKAEKTDSMYDAKDIARSLLIMISNNIGQLAFHNAVRHKCGHVYFAGATYFACSTDDDFAVLPMLSSTGNFLRHENTMAMRTLAFAIRFWSKGKMEGLFLRHEGYCGSLGAFLSTLDLDGATHV